MTICINTIILSGKSLSKFQKTLKLENKKYIFSLNQIITIPVDLEEKEYDEWKLENWGCNDVVDSDVKILKNKIIIKCSTNWSPPFEWGKGVVKRFKDLSIEIGYYNGSDEYYGIIKNGIMYMMEIASDDIEYDGEMEDFTIIDKNLKKHLNFYEMDKKMSFY